MHDPFLQEIREKFRSSFVLVVLSGNSANAVLSVQIFALLLAAFRRCCFLSYLPEFRGENGTVELSSTRRSERYQIFRKKFFENF